jgi:hypothetical protein
MGAALALGGRGTGAHDRTAGRAENPSKSGREAFRWDQPVAASAVSIEPATSGCCLVWGTRGES